MAFEKYYLEFGGTQYGRISVRSPFGGEDNFTIEFRHRVPTGGAGGGCLLSSFVDIGVYGFGVKITIDNTGKPTIQLSRWTITKTLQCSGVFVANTWYHCIITIDRSGVMKWYIDSVEKNSKDITALSGNLFDVAKHLGVSYNPPYGGNPETYTNYYTGDILLFGYFVDSLLTQEEITERYNYWSFHRGTEHLSWGSNIDDGVGLVATDVLGGEPCVLATPPADPVWRLYGVYADPVFELWRDWDDLISMCLLPFGSITVAALVIVAACTDANGGSVYDNDFPEAESKYDATALYLAAIDAATYNPVEAETKYDGTGAYMATMDYDEIYIGHKFLGE